MTSVAPFARNLAAAAMWLAVAAAAQADGLADFGRHKPSSQARSVADWIVASKDHAGAQFIIVDKRGAAVYVFGNDGRVRGSSPVLLGAAVGDDTVPGIGDRPLSQVLPHERTTPAGRFVAEAGRNSHGEDIVWVDYDAAVSMHRVRPTVAAERRLQRLASKTVADNRISYGCINVPRSFYETQISPTVQAGRTIVYVLPEQKSIQQVFGAYTVTAGSRPAAAPNSQRRKAGQA